MKNAGELWKIKPKPFPILTSGKTLEINLMDFREFDSALTEHDNELISEIEKKIKIAEEWGLHITAEAFTEILNLIKEK